MASARAQQYLDGLPNGLDSHPTFVQKASVFRQFLELAAGVDVSGLPRALAVLAREPPPVTAWITEVRATATYLAITDLQGWSDQQLLTRALTLNRALVSGPLYRILMTVVSSTMLVRGAPDRWAALHRGIGLTSHLDSETSATMTLAFPKGLVPPVIARCYATAIQAVFEVSRIKRPSVAVEASDDERAVYRCAWQ